MEISAQKYLSCVIFGKQTLHIKNGWRSGFSMKYTLHNEPRRDPLKNEKNKNKKTQNQRLRNLTLFNVSGIIP